MARVLLLRERERCAESARRLREAGHEAVSLPLMEIRDTGKPLPGGEFDAVAFTSASAVSVVAGRPDAVARLAGLPAFCVGQATAETARAAGFSRVLQGGGDGESLARLIASEAPRRGLRRLLHPVAKHRAFDLAAALDGIEVRAAEVYEAVLVDPGAEALRAALEGCDAVFLHSPRSAAHFASLCRNHETGGPVARLTLIAISEKTARAARGAPAGSLLVADAPEERAMIALLQARRFSDEIGGRNSGAQRISRDAPGGIHMSDDDKRIGSGRRGSKPKTIDLGAKDYAAREPEPDAPDEASASEPAADVVAAGESLFTPADERREAGAEHPEEVEPVVGMSTEDRDALSTVETGRYEDHAPAQAQGEASGEDAPPAAADAPRGEAPAPKAPAAGGGGFGRTLAAAAIGGVVALGLAGGLGASGLLSGVPGFSASAPVSQGDDGGIASLRSEIAALKDGLAAVEARPEASATAGTETLEARIEALAERIAAAESEAGQLREALAAAPQGTQDPAATAALGRQIEELSQRLARAESTLGGLGEGAAGQAAAATEDLSQRLDGEISELGERLAGAEAVSQEAASAARSAAEGLAALASRVSGLDATLAEVRTIAEEVRAAREAADTEGQMLARAVAANALRTAYERGEPYGGLLASARTLTGEVEGMAALERHAAAGVPTGEELAEAFRPASQSALDALAPEADGVVAQLMSNARNLVKVRPAGPQAGDAPEAVLSRVEAAVEAGDFAAALAEWRTLPEASRAAASGFGAMLEARVETDAAISQVLGSLAARGQG